MDYKKGRAIIFIALLTITLVPTNLNNIQFASAATTTFAHTPATSSGSPTGNSQGIDFYGTLSGTILGDITVKDGITPICTAVAPVGEWSCSGTPDWTTPSSGTSNKQFSASAAGMTTAYTTVYWAETNDPPVITNAPADANVEYAATGTTLLSYWRATDTDPDFFDLDKRFALFSSGTTCGSYGSYTGVSTGGWTSGQEITQLHGKYFALGCYQYRMIFTDDGSGSDTDETTVIKNVDTTTPIIVTSASDYTFEQGDTTTKNLIWKASDLLAGNYIIERKLSSQAWTSATTERTSTAWTTNVNTAAFDVAANANGDSLAAGVWNYRIEFSDTTGNTLYDTADLYLISSTNPSFTSTPSDVAYESGNTDTKNIFWEFTDYIAGDTWETRYQASSFSSCTGGTQYDSGDYAGVGSTNTTGNINVGSLTASRYYCTLITDLAENTAWDQVYVAVTSAESPTPNSPGDLTIEDGVGTRDIDWTWTDNYANPTDTGYWETRYQSTSFGSSCVGGTLLNSASGATYWEGTGGSRSETGLSPSTSTYYCIGIIDEANNVGFDEVYLGVTASSAPVPNTPTDLTLEDGVATRDIDWTWADNFDNPSTTGAWVTQYKTTSFAGTCSGGTPLNSNSWDGLAGSRNETGLSPSTSTYYCIGITDEAGNVGFDEVYLEVTASSAPSMTAPNNLDYENGNTISRTIYFEFTDNFNNPTDTGTWIIKSAATSESACTGSTEDSDTWSGYGETIEIEGGSLTTVTYYCITVTDEGGYSNTETSFINVATQEAPQLTSTPSDIGYESGNTVTKNVDWTATDSYAYQYIIQKRNGTDAWETVRTWTAWTTGVAITAIDVGSLTYGTWTFQIMFNETTTEANGDTTNDTMVVTVVTQQAPQITSTPSDISYEDGNTVTKNVDWTATDSYAYQYIIQKRNGTDAWETVRTWTAWTTGVAITAIDVGSLTYGTWTFQIMFNETTTEANGDTTNDTMVVTVSTATSPSISAEPDVQYIQGNDYTISWNFTDETEGLSWTIFTSLNNETWSSIASDSWTGTDGYAEADINFHSADYYYMINVTDSATNWAVDYIFVTISPNVTINDFYYTEDYTNLEGYYPMDGDALDYSGNERDGTNNGVTFVDGQHDDAGEFESSQADYISYANYNDLRYNGITISFWAIHDSLPNQGGAISLMTDGETSASDGFWWHINAFNYQLRVEDVSNGETAWTDDTISTEIDVWYHYVVVLELNSQRIYRNNILIGEYSKSFDMTDMRVDEDLRLIVGATYLENVGNWHDGLIDDVRIFSEAKSEDYISYLYNQFPNYHSNEKGWLTFSAFDETEGTYTAYMNTTLIGEGSWTNNTIYAHSLGNGTLAPGYYNLTLNINDGTYTETYNLAIFYQDTPPTIYITPDDTEISSDETTTLRWAATDPYPATYIIYRNGTNIYSGTWAEDYYISLTTSVLNIGAYNYTIIMADLIGGTSTATTIMTISQDISFPIIISAPPNHDIAADSTGNELIWEISDISSGTYIIYRNETEWDTGSWTTEIIINIDTSTVSLFNFTIIITDSYSNEIIDQVWVISRTADSTDPAIYSIPTDINYNLGETGNIIYWAFADGFPDVYNITIDGDPLVTNEVWDMENYISLNVDGWFIGVYTIQITVYDTSGNSASDTVIVTIS